MTIKQRDYIKDLLEEESDFGAYGRRSQAIARLGGENWEQDYESIPNYIVTRVIDMLQESIHTSLWAVEHGYD